MRGRDGGHGKEMERKCKKKKAEEEKRKKGQDREAGKKGGTRKHRAGAER